jgi:predicted transcriptional regulator of viral defense system
LGSGKRFRLFFPYGGTPQPSSKKLAHAIATISHLWHIIAMKFTRLLEIVGQEPVFHSSLLLAGELDSVDLGRQLSRWVKSGRLIQLRRGLYTLSEPHQKIAPHPFFVANRLKRASYVSLQSALEYHGLIPEYVPSITSVTTGRPETFSTPLGSFIFKHIKKEIFFGYQEVELGSGQSAFVARPEKALLDLFYLTPGSDDIRYLKELRLQNAGNLNSGLLLEQAREFESRKVLKAAQRIHSIVEELEES